MISTFSSFVCFFNASTRCCANGCCNSKSVKENATVATRRIVSLPRGHTCPPLPVTVTGAQAAEPPVLASQRPLQVTVGIGAEGSGCTHRKEDSAEPPSHADGGTSWRTCPAGSLECSLTSEILGLPPKPSSGIPSPDGRTWTASAGVRGHRHCPGHTPLPPSPSGTSRCLSIPTVTQVSTSRSQNPGTPAPSEPASGCPGSCRGWGQCPTLLFVTTVVGSPGSCEGKATTRETENGAQTLHGEGTGGWAPPVPS